MICDHDRFWPFEYASLKGEAGVSNVWSVVFSDTRPSFVIGHFVVDQ